MCDLHIILCRRPHLRGTSLIGNICNSIHQHGLGDTLLCTFGMQNTFGHLALSHRPFFVPRGFWMSFKDYDGEPTNVREHQDAYEFFTRLQVSPVVTSLHRFPTDPTVPAWPELSCNSKTRKPYMQMTSVE